MPRGCINVHGSLLPRYRGAAPVQWAVIHGDAETGVSIMQLDEGMDTGPVFLERRVAIGPDETAGELLERLAPIGAQALLEVIAAIAGGTARAVAQDHAAASHAPMLAKADGAIDFGQPAAAVAARIRGVDPWPGAQAMLRGQPVKLFRARAVPAGAPDRAPPRDQAAGPGSPPEQAEGAAQHAGDGQAASPAPQAGAGRAAGAAPHANAGHAEGTAPPAGAGQAEGIAPPAGAGLADRAAPPAGAGLAAPGTVLAIDAGGARIACGDGAVVIRELQAAGRKRMAAAQFAAGRGIAVGDVLGRAGPA